MKNKRVAILVGSICLLAIFLVLPLMVACTAPEPAPAPAPAPAPEPEVFHWRYQSILPVGDNEYDFALVEKMRRLEEVSEGRIKVDIFPVGGMAGYYEAAMGLINGVFEMADNHGGFVTLDPVLEYRDLPGAVLSTSQYHELIMDKGWTDITKAAYAKLGVKFTGKYSNHAGCGGALIFGDFAWRKADDVAGKKVFTYGGVGYLIGELGGAPTDMSTDELYMGLKLGTIDAMMYPTAELETMGFKEVVKYVNFPYVLAPGGMMFLFNMDAWNSLPADLQYTIENECWTDEWLMDLWNRYYPLNKAGVDAALEYGVERVDMPEAEVMKVLEIARKVWNSEVSPRSADCAAVVKIFEDAIDLLIEEGRYGKEWLYAGGPGPQ